MHHGAIPLAKNIQRHTQTRNNNLQRADDIQHLFRPILGQPIIHKQTEDEKQDILEDHDDDEGLDGAVAEGVRDVGPGCDVRED